MHLELLLDLCGPLEELAGHAVNLALHIKLVPFDFQDGLISLSDDESLRCHVLVDFLESFFRVRDALVRAKLVQVHRLARQTRLHFEDVQECLSADLASMRLQENVLTSLISHLIGKSNSIVKLELLKERLSELGEAVRVVPLLSEDQGQSNVFERV